MGSFLIAMACLAVFYIWHVTTRKRIQARTERIRRVHIQGPDARICYMNMKGKRYIWQITIESVTQKGQDWIITAWCYEKNEFLIFYASRMYEYFDLKRFQEIKNVPAYFTERFGPKVRPRSA